MSNLPDAQVLHFLYDRLVQVHGENPNTDYMRRLLTITERMHHLGHSDTDYGEPEQNLVSLAVDRNEALARSESLDRRIRNEVERLKQKRLGKSY